VCRVKLFRGVSVRRGFFALLKRLLFRGERGFVEGRRLNVDPGIFVAGCLSLVDGVGLEKPECLVEECEVTELLDAAVEYPAGLELGVIGFLEIKLPLLPKRVAGVFETDDFAGEERFTVGVKGFVYVPFEPDLEERVDVTGFLGTLTVRVGVWAWLRFLTVLPLRLERVVAGFRTTLGVCVVRGVVTGVLTVAVRFTLEPDERYCDVETLDVVDGLV